MCMKNLPKHLQAIFIDVDGTLRNPDGEISERNRAALRLAKEHGILPVICTGRPRGHARNLGLEVGADDYCICCNGAGVLDIKNDRLLYKRLTPAESILGLYRYLAESLPRSEEIHWDFKCVDADYSTRNDEYSIGKGRIPITEPLEVFLHSHEVMQLVLVHRTDTDLMRQASNLIAESNFGLKILNQQKHMVDPSFPDRGVPYIDVGDQMISKGLGVREFCKILDFAPENCVAIGDDINDLPMFEVCGFRVAMENSLPEVLAVADYITLSNAEDGVADFIEKVVSL